MIFKCPKGFLMLRLFVYALFMGFIVYIFIRGGGRSHFHLFLYILISIAVIAAAFLHISISGFNIRIDEKRIYKEWGIFGHAFRRSKIAALDRIALSINDESLVLGEITERGTFGKSSFGVPRGFNYLKKDPNYISISDFKGFVREVFARAEYIEMDEGSKKAASDMKIVLGQKVKIVG